MRHTIGGRQEQFKALDPVLGLLCSTGDYQDRAFSFGRDSGNNEGARGRV